MSKNNSLRKFVFKTQAKISLVIIVSYTLITYWYFVSGLDESNFQIMHSEAQNFAEHYSEDRSHLYPPSIHFSGSTQWHQLPPWVKQYFSDVQNSTVLLMQDTKVLGDEFNILWPKRIFFIVVQPLKDGEVFYLTREIDTQAYSEFLQNRLKNKLQLTWPLALLFFIAIHIVIFFLLKRMTLPLERLEKWNDDLDLNNVQQLIPDFSFDEFNKIAQQQQASTLRITQMIAKEQDFLRHASHELRTPIAVVKSNVAILTRLVSTPKSIASVERINRASLNMQHMTETLLWLSSEETKILENDRVELSELIETIIEDNQYLLQGKAVKVVEELSPCSLNLAATPCRLILNNLIRNAFQYTATGEISIYCHAGQVIINNVNTYADQIDHSGADYGYGLGLRLVDKIVKKVSWSYQNIEIAGGRKVTINFAEKD
jgi:signal transduction histidine kinase